MVQLDLTDEQASLLVTVLHIAREHIPAGDGEYELALIEELLSDLPEAE